MAGLPRDGFLRNGRHNEVAFLEQRGNARGSFLEHRLRPTLKLIRGSFW